MKISQLMKILLLNIFIIVYSVAAIGILPQEIEENNSTIENPENNITTEEERR